MILTIHLHPEKEPALNAAAQAQGISAERWLQEIWLKNGWMAPQRQRQFPPLNEVRAEFLEGGAYQIDHHVYGLPKK